MTKIFLGDGERELCADAGCAEYAIADNCFYCELGQRCMRHAEEHRCDVACLLDTVWSTHPADAPTAEYRLVLARTALEIMHETGSPETTLLAAQRSLVDFLCGEGADVETLIHHIAGMRRP